MKYSNNNSVKTISKCILILALTSQSALSYFSHLKKRVTFEEQPFLIDFARSGGEGLGGAAWLDFDADDDLDLFLTNGVGAANGLFRNNGDGTFTNVAVAAGVANDTGNSGVVVGDIDNDGFPDIFVSGEGFLIGSQQSPAKLYHNNRDGTFSDITVLSGVTGAGSALSAAMGDINNDGFLDIFVTSPGHIPFLTGPGTEESHGNKLYLNNGDLTFDDISVSAGVDGLYPDPTRTSERLISDGACVVGMSDYNRDHWLDIIVGNCNGFPLELPNPSPVRPTPFNLFRNNGNLTFTDQASDAGLNINGFWMGLAFGDFDKDGNIDFAATSTGTLNNSLHVLMRNNGDGTFTDIAEENLSNTPFGWGITAADFNNDGYVDLFKVGSLPIFGAIGSQGSHGQLLFNGRKGFTEYPDTLSIDLSFDYTTGLAQGDYNGDGFVDLVIIRSPWRIGETGNPNGQPVLLKNQGNRNQWLTVRPIGTISNRMGIGARIEVFTGGGLQVREVRAGSSFASSESPWPTFGLGKKRFAFIRTRWPSGLTEWFLVHRLRRTYDLVEGNGHFQTYQ